MCIHSSTLHNISELVFHLKSPTKIFKVKFNLMLRYTAGQKKDIPRAADTRNNTFASLIIVKRNKHLTSSVLKESYIYLYRNIEINHVQVAIAYSFKVYYLC